MGQDIHLTYQLADYLKGIQPQEPELFRALRKETESLGEISVMQIGWVQGRFMQTLIRATGAKTYLEVGIFTGYSALAVALALPDAGKVYALDLSEEWTSIAQKYWQKAGVDHKIELRIGDAKETLAELAETNLAGRLDIMFIDADKTGMRQYFDMAMDLLRPGGLVLVDNVLWSGAVIDPEVKDDDTEAIRQFNIQMSKEERAHVSTIPVGDGLTLAVKL
jgi:caffeoyl-CoA O-methyltransferase